MMDANKDGVIDKTELHKTISTLMDGEVGDFDWAHSANRAINEIKIAPTNEIALFSKCN